MMSLMKSWKVFTQTVVFFHGSDSAGMCCVVGMINTLPKPVQTCAESIKCMKMLVGALLVGEL